LPQVTVGHEQKQGELYVALTYNDHVQRLLVGIIEGRNVKASAPGVDTCTAGRWRSLTTAFACADRIIL
jgi:hypothetical protein